jgi:PhnB protein
VWTADIIHANVCGRCTQFVGSFYHIDLKGRTMNMLNVYLTFNGNCTEAMRFYEQALDAKLEMLMTVGQSPMAGQMPAEFAERAMHARLALNGGVVMACDTIPGCGAPYNGMHGFSLTLTYPTFEEAARRFDALSAGGNVTMPFAKTFYAEGSGMLTDKFGLPWIINGNLNEVEPHSVA